MSANHILLQQRIACLRSLSLLVVNEISNKDRVSDIVLAGQECGTPHDKSGWVLVGFWWWFAGQITVLLENWPEYKSSL